MSLDNYGDGELYLAWFLHGYVNRLKIKQFKRNTRYRTNLRCSTCHRNYNITDYVKYRQHSNDNTRDPMCMANYNHILDMNQKRVRNNQLYSSFVYFVCKDKIQNI